MEYRIRIQKLRPRGGNLTLKGKCSTCRLKINSESVEELCLQKNSWEEDLGVWGECTSAKRLPKVLATLAEIQRTEQRRPLTSQAQWEHSALIWASCCLGDIGD